MAQCPPKYTTDRIVFYHSSDLFFKATPVQTMKFTMKMLRHLEAPPLDLKAPLQRLVAPLQRLGAPLQSRELHFSVWEPRSQIPRLRKLVPKTSPIYSNSRIQLCFSSYGLIICK